MTLAHDYWLFAAIGFLAQIIDGTLGMAFGVIMSSSLLAFGVPPAIASAAVHIAEIATTGISGLSHLWHRNVDRRLLIRLAASGVAGGAFGAYVLVDLIPKRIVGPLVTAYLLAVALLIFDRILRRKPRPLRIPTIPLGLGGGFLDAVGGGGWGSVVASSLIATGAEPRRSVGTANTAEFFVAASVSAAFLATLDLSQLWKVIVALIVGGAAAAPFSGWLLRVLPARVAMMLVAGIILGISIYNVVRIDI